MVKPAKTEEVLFFAVLNELSLCMSSWLIPNLFAFRRDAENFYLFIQDQTHTAALCT